MPYIEYGDVRAVIDLLKEVDQYLDNTDTDRARELQEEITEWIEILASEVA